MLNNVLGYSLISLLLGALGCSGEEEILGTGVKPVSSDFKWENHEVQLAAKSFDFTDISTAFHLDVDFGEEITSVLTIEGLESKAQKQFVNTASQLTSSNTTWKGGQDEPVSTFFKEGEKVVVKLEAYGTSDVYYDTIVIEKAQAFADISTDMKGANLNFDPGSASTFTWWIKAGVGDLEDSSLPKIDDQYLVMEGTAPSNSVYVGGASYGGWNGPYIKQMNGDPLSSDPSQLYFNIYVYGTGDTDSELYFNFYEADGDHVGSNAKTDDAVQLKIVPSHKGWKLLSYKYSDLPFSTYAPGGGSGNKIHEPHKIALIDIALQATSQGGSAKVVVDYPFFTINQPFDPSRY